MMKWFPVLAVGSVCLLGGWMLGRLRRESAEPPPYEVREGEEPRPALVRRAQQLWSADANQCDGRQVVRFMIHLGETLDDGSWRAVSAAVPHALDQQRSVESLQDGILLANNAVLPRFVRSACVEEIVAQIRRANSGGYDAGQINTILGKSAELPIPGEGYLSSPQEALVLAALRAGDLPRAGEYLSKLAWPKESHPDQMEAAEIVHDIVNIGLDVAGGKIDPARVIRAWNGQARDAVGRSLLQPILENAVLSAGTEFDRKPMLPSLESLFKASMSVESAEAFRGRILQLRQRGLIRGNELSILETSNLVGLYCSSFRKPAYAYSYWMRAAEATLKSNGNDARRVADFYGRSAAAATSEQDRVTSLRHAAMHWERSGHPEAALKAVEEAISSVQDAAIRKELSALSEGLKAALRKAEAAASQKRQVETERQERTVKRMRELILQARSDGRPARRSGRSRKSYGI